MFATALWVQRAQLRRCVPLSRFPKISRPPGPVKRSGSNCLSVTSPSINAIAVMYGRLWSAVSRVSGFHFSGSLPMISTDASWLSIVIDFTSARSLNLLSQKERRLNRALAVIFRRPIFDARVQNHRGRPVAPSWQTGLRIFRRRCPAKLQAASRNPFALRKSAPGPVMPARASNAAKTPCRAAFAKATPFQCESSPTRACRMAAPCDTGDVHGVTRLFRIELHQASRRPAQLKTRRRSHGPSRARECSPHRRNGIALRRRARSP